MIFDRVKLIFLPLMVLVSAAEMANAEEIYNSAMSEFSQTCPAVSGTVDNTKARFLDLGWETTEDKDIGEVNTPDDIFKNSKLDTAYQVELENGAFWFGGSGRLKITGRKAIFCTIVFYGGASDQESIEADFQIIYPGEPEVVEGNGERRIVVQTTDGQGAAIHQQIIVPGEDDLVMFRTFNVMPRLKK